jgi:hypothetical protein
MLKFLSRVWYPEPDDDPYPDPDDEPLAAA